METLNPSLVQKPNNTTFSLVWDPNFFLFIHPAQVQSLFGGLRNIIISYIETSTVAPTIPIGPSKNIVYRRNISPEKECWDDPLSP